MAEQATPLNLVAINGTQSAATAWLAVTTPLSGVTLLSPTNFQADATSLTTAQLSWGTSSGATGYSLYEWINNGAMLVAQCAAGTTSAKIGGLSAGATTPLNLVAINGTQSAATAWLGVMTPT
jgi:hypothetical protein